MAVLQLDAILTNARKVKVVPKDKKSRNQEKFDSMILMEYTCPGIGLIKLTVGVMRRTHDKVQYCITAIEFETRKAPLKDASLCPGKTQYMFTLRWAFAGGTSHNSNNPSLKRITFLLQIYKQFQKQKLMLKNELG